MAASLVKTVYLPVFKCFYRGSKRTLCGPRSIYTAEMVKLVLLTVSSVMLLIFYVRFCLKLCILYLFLVELKSCGNILVNAGFFFSTGQEPLNRVQCTAMFLYEIKTFESNHITLANYDILFNQKCIAQYLEYCFNCYN